MFASYTSYAKKSEKWLTLLLWHHSLLNSGVKFVGREFRHVVSFEMFRNVSCPQKNNPPGLWEILTQEHLVLPFLDVYVKVCLCAVTPDNLSLL